MSVIRARRRFARLDADAGDGELIGQLRRLIGDPLKDVTCTSTRTSEAARRTCGRGDNGVLPFGATGRGPGHHSLTIK